jgi:nitrogen regulatory protein P-II 1
MTKVECIIRPDRLEDVSDALAELNILGMTTQEVRGCGRQLGYVERYRGQEYKVRLLAKKKLEIVVRDEQVDDVIRVVTEAGRTGDVGDGKIFLWRIDDAVRIRTGERGEAAL